MTPTPGAPTNYKGWKPLYHESPKPPLLHLAPSFPTCPPLTLCRAHLAVGFAVCRSWMGMREEREESEQVKAAPFPCPIHLSALQHLPPALPSPWLMKAAGPSHNWALLFRVEYMMLKSFSPALSRFSSSSRSSAMQPTSSSSFSFFFLPRVYAVWLRARPPNPYWG